MPRLLTVVCLLLLIVGLVIGWPLLRASVKFRAVNGQILDVIAVPIDDQQVSLIIAYEYPLPGPGRNRALGYALTDKNLQPLQNDHIVRAADTDAWKNALYGHNVRVYYDVNDPIDTAFMISPLSTTHGMRPEYGMLMIIFGLSCGILGQLARRRR